MNVSTTSVQLRSKNAIWGILFFVFGIITARKRSLRRLCFYRCLSFILFTGGACVAGGGVRGRGGCVAGGACMAGGACVAGGCVAGGGMCVVLFSWGGVRGIIRGGRAWFYSGGMRGFIRGGMRGFIRGGMCGFIRGVRGFIRGGVRGFFSFSGYNEIRSMSGRYASYWNAFLFLLFILGYIYHVRNLIFV